MSAAEVPTQARRPPTDERLWVVARELLEKRTTEAEVQVRYFVLAAIARVHSLARAVVYEFQQNGRLYKNIWCQWH